MTAFIYCAALTSQLHAAWQTPLDAQEIQSAATAVMSRIALTTSDNFNSPIDSDNRTQTRSISAGDPQHPLGIQVLLVELKEQKQQTNQDARIAEIFIFNYKRGVAELNLFDVANNRVVSTQEITSAHLPLSEPEIEYSKTLIWDNAEFRERIQREYESLTATPINTINSPLTNRLQTRVSIWVPNRNASGQSELCARQRCALISVFSEDNHSFSIEPVIDLMSGQIYLDMVR